jgi:hypothetical protein
MRPSSLQLLCCESQYELKPAQPARHAVARQLPGSNKVLPVQSSKSAPLAQRTTVIDCRQGLTPKDPGTGLDFWSLLE